MTDAWNATELEQRIIAFLSEETGWRQKRIHVGSRLSQDIGMDGDDAVEFFEKFGVEFHVDLTVLYDRWNEHFVSEGRLGAPSLRLLVVFGGAAFAGVLLHEVVKWIPL